MENLKIEATSIITQDPYKREKNKKNYFVEYDRIYPFTTECISSYIKDLDNKRVLCVGSSGDHAIESFYKGASKVDTFDINKLTNYYQELKIMALKFLEYDEFFTLFSDKTCKDDKVAMSILNKLRDKLTEDTYDLFSYLIKYFGYNDGLLSSRLFYSKPQHEDLVRRNCYSAENRFYDVKERILDKDITCINTDLFMLSYFLEDLYDVIYLSNITSYIVKIEDAVSYIKQLLDHLADNGRIYFAYFYGDDKKEINPLYSTIGKVEKEEIESIYGDGYKDAIYSIKK